MNILSLGASLDVKGPFDATPGASLGRAQYELRIGAFVNRELEVVSFEGTEKLSTPYVYDVVFASSVPVPALQAGVFGFPACLSIQVPKKEPRVIQGLAVGFEAIGAAEAELETKTRRYMARVVPRLWLLNHNRKYRVFQEQSAVDIACSVLEDAGITPEIRLERSDYPPIPFMYQRGETDLEFLHHVLAVAGIFYYFKHASGLLDRLVPGAGEAGAYTGALGGGFGAVTSAAGATTALVLCDRARHTSALNDTAVSAGGGFGVASSVGDAWGSLGGALGSVASTVGAAASVVGGALADALAYDGNGQAASATERVFVFRARNEVRPKRVAIGDWSVADCAGVRMEDQAAAATLDASAGVAVVFGMDSQASLSAGARVDLDVDAVPIAMKDASVMEYQWDAGLLAARDPFAERALSQLRSDRITARGESDCRRLGPGYRFKLARHPIGPINTEYVVTAVRSSGYAPDHLPENYPLYRNVFECVPATVDPRPAKPPQRAPLGLEAAVVVGPVYGDVNCDRIGRIQVRFRWARGSATHTPDAEGTCWVYWLERWAGNGFGTMTLPRVGTEVLVDFLQAEGGRPVAVGQLYSRVNGPPFDLPGESSKVGIRSRTIPSGPGSEISIDDNPYAEQVLVRANGDLETRVACNTRTELGGTYDLTVANERRETTNGDASLAFAKDVTVKVQGSQREEIGEDRAEIVLGSVNEYVEGDASRVVGGRVDTVTQGVHSHVFGADSLERHLGHHAVVVAGKDGAGQASAVLHVEGAARAYAKNLIEAASPEGLTLSCGDSHITIRKDSVTIASPTITLFGKTVQVTASDTAAVAAKTATVAGSDSVTVSGANKATLSGQSATVVLDSNATVQGSAIKLGSGGGGSSSSPAQAKTATVTTIALTDAEGNALPHQRVILRKGGAGGDERVVVLDHSGQLKIDGDDPFDMFFPDLPWKVEVSEPLRPYIARQGDSLLGLSARYAFDASKVWNDPKNSALRKTRKDDGNVLLPGDVLHIPNIKPVWLSASLGTTNTITVPSKSVSVNVCFSARGKPMAGEPYVVVGADVDPGSLDDAGFFRATVPASVKILEVHLTKRNEVHVLKIGHLDPPESPSGLCTRLTMLGFYGRGAGSAAGSTEDLEVGLRLFQDKNALQVSGEHDDATAKKLLDLFGR